MRALFVSDVHYSARRPEQAARFLDFLARHASRAEDLYILGDLFDQWLGDDDITPPYPDLLRSLRKLSDGGTRVWVMYGNHDFLMGQRFQDETGCRLIDDPTVIDIEGERVLLMHGDTLCSDDIEYQQFRAYVRDRERQQMFLSLPFEMRAAQAASLRNQSAEKMQLKPDDIMDVNTDTALGAMREHRARYLIHGHTHRPNVHEIDDDGDARTRLVLGEWYGGDQVVIWNGRGPRLVSAASLATSD